MKPLEKSDSFHLQMAIGWLGLGNHLEAKRELENITPESLVDPDVLRARWLVYAEAEKWDLALEIARALVQIAPDYPNGWIKQALSLRYIPGAGAEQAWNALLPVANKFPLEPEIPYDLACYATQIGKFTEAKDWLRRAFAVGDADAIKRKALKDPDLDPLWNEIGKALSLREG
jgi:tetratricopeptide (TPR) repeat protein